MFHNCLAAMRPKSSLQDLLTTCNVVSHLHNEFVKWLVQLKNEIMASGRSNKPTQDSTFFQTSPGRISTTADMWTVDTTKAAFLGVTAHWIEVKKGHEEIWMMHSEVIGFQTVSGDHSGKNLG